MMESSKFSALEYTESPGRIAGALLCLLFFLISASCQPNAGTKEITGPVIATINGQPVLVKEYNDFLAKSTKGLNVPDPSSMSLPLNLYYLNRYLDDRLMLAEAGRQAVEVSKAEVEAWFKDNGVNADEEKPEEKEFIRERLAIEKLLDLVVQPRVKVEEAEIQELYGHESEFMQRPPMIKARMLMFDSPGQAGEACEKLNGGKTFKQVAAEFSKNGQEQIDNDLGWVTEGQLPEELDGPLFEQEADSFSRVIKTSYGYHIFYVEETKDAHTIPYEEAREPMLAKIKEDKFEAAYRKWLKQLRQRARININYELL